jgi:hypothetical protein
MIKYRYTWYEEIDVPSWSPTWFPKSFKEKLILALDENEAEKKINVIKMKKYKNYKSRYIYI